MYSPQPYPSGSISRSFSLALAAGATFYTHNLGIAPLRAALANYVSELHGATSPDHVAVTSAGVNALMLAAQLVVGAGDRVVAVTPLWPNLVEIPKILGAHVETVALGYGEPVWPFLTGGALTAATGLALERAGRGDHDVLGFREGYLVVSLTWLLAAAFAASIYILSGEAQLDRPVDAYFEAMSGFTTTGASVVTDPDALDRSLLMWRQFTQWLGGLGIIVLAVLAVGALFDLPIQGLGRHLGHVFVGIAGLVVAGIDNRTAPG